MFMPIKWFEEGRRMISGSFKFIHNLIDGSGLHGMMRLGFSLEIDVATHRVSYNVKNQPHSTFETSSYDHVVL